MYFSVFYVSSAVKTVLHSGGPKCAEPVSKMFYCSAVRAGRMVQETLAERERYNGMVLHCGGPKCAEPVSRMFYCSAVRAGRMVQETLAERERYNGMVLHSGGPKCAEPVSRMIPLVRDK